jgi:hypothetical protein
VWRRLGSFRLAAVWLVGTACAGCISAAVSVSQPTAVERQLLGAYESLDADLVRLSSVRSADVGFRNSDAMMREEALRARAIQRFNADDIVQLKAGGCLVELLSTRLGSRPCPAANDAQVKRRLDRVIEEENGSRRAILAWAAQEDARARGRQASSTEYMRDLNIAYHELLRQTAKAGDWIESRPGIFVQMEKAVP